MGSTRWIGVKTFTLPRVTTRTNGPLAKTPLIDRVGRVHLRRQSVEALELRDHRATTARPPRRKHTLTREGERH